MDVRDDIVVVMITAPSKNEAEALTQQLLTGRLAACVNAACVSSKFIWKGAIDTAEEVLLIAKTRRSLLSKLEECVRRVHSYEVPEIIVLPVIAGHTPYLDWVVESTS